LFLGEGDWMGEKQFWLGDVEPCEEKFSLVKNGRMFVKPGSGGLWTSPVRDDGGGWLSWCKGEDFWVEGKDRLFELVPFEGLNVYVINSYVDLMVLYEEYGLRDDVLKHFAGFACLDFERLSEVYDGIYLTDVGQYSTRFTVPSLYGWDCACVLWLRWVFSEVREIKDWGGKYGWEKRGTGS
jgi:hypothetical protein